jgi:hypothetical protein
MYGMTELSLIEKALDGLVQNGAIGIVLGCMLWINYKMIMKLFTVIDSNTKAWSNAHDKLNVISDQTKPRNRRDYE